MGTSPPVKKRASLLKLNKQCKSSFSLDSILKIVEDTIFDSAIFRLLILSIVVIKIIIRVAARAHERKCLTLKNVFNE